MFLVLILVCLLPLLCVDSCNDCPEKPFPPQTTLGCLGTLNPRVFIGQRLVLNCTADNSSQLYFTWANKVDDGSELSNYTRVISPCILQLNIYPFRRLNVINETETGFYTIRCTHRTTNESWGQRLQYEYEPHGIDKWNAVIDNWNTLRLDVQLGLYIRPEKLNLRIEWRTHGMKNLSACSYNNTTCFLDSGRFAGANNYYFTITISTPIDKDVNYTDTIHVETPKYVKPARVTFGEIRPVRRSVSLEWKLATHRPLIYRVKTVNISINNVTEKNANVTDLRPDTQYEFCVSAISTAGGFWSDEICVKNRTKQDDPEAGPYIGGYAEHLNGGARTVILYVKPPDAQFQNGYLKNYTVEVSPGSGQKVVPCCSTYNITLEISASIHNVSVSVCNDAGYSPLSRLIIPPVNRVNPPKQVRVAYNSTTVRAFWVTNPEAELTSVLWCESSQEYQICKGPIHWVFVSGKQSSAVLPVSGEDITRLQFGVAVITKSGNSSITWSNCVYDMNRVPEKKPAIQPLESQPRLSLTVRWSLPTCSERALVTGYTLQWCAGMNSSGNCETATLDVPAEKHIISNLQEGVSYEVRLKEISPGGLGPFSDPEFGIPLETNLKAGPITAIVLGGLVVLVFVGGIAVWKIRLIWKKKEEIFVPPFEDDSDSYYQTFRSETVQGFDNTVTTRACSGENNNNMAGPITNLANSATEVITDGESQTEAKVVGELLTEVKTFGESSTEVQRVSESSSEVKSAWDSSASDGADSSDDNSPESPYVGCHEPPSADVTLLSSNKCNSTQVPPVIPESPESPDLTSNDSLPSASPYAAITTEERGHPDRADLHSTQVKKIWKAEETGSTILDDDTSSSVSSSASLIGGAIPSADVTLLSSNKCNSTQVPPVIPESPESPDLTSNDSLPSASPYAAITTEERGHPDRADLHSTQVKKIWKAEETGSTILDDDTSSSVSSSASLIGGAIPSADVTLLSSNKCNSTQVPPVIPESPESPDLTSNDSLPSASPYAAITTEERGHPDRADLHSTQVKKIWKAEETGSTILDDDTSSSVSSSASLIGGAIPSSSWAPSSTQVSSDRHTGVTSVVTMDNNTHIIGRLLADTKL